MGDDREAVEAGDALITVEIDGTTVFRTDGVGNTMAPADYAGRQAAALALAAAAAALAELPAPPGLQ